MKPAFLVVVILQVTLIVTGASTRERHRRMLKAQPVPKDIFLWEVDIQFNNGFMFEHICAGTLVHDDWVLTSARCVNGFENSPHKYMIDVDKPRAYVANGRKIGLLPVSRIVKHPHFDEHTGANDIALMKIVRGSITIESNHMLALANPALNFSDRWCWVNGWGMSEDSPSTFYLRGGSVFMESNIDCQSLYRKPFFKESQLCTRWDAAVVPCYRDNGGGLMCYTDDQKEALVGIVSDVSDCGSKNPIIYTKVSVYVGWIFNVMQNY